MRRIIAAALGALVLPFSGCFGGDDEAEEVPPLPRPGVTVAWAVGDGSLCGGDVDDRVAAMIARDRPDRFLFLGDVYTRGTERQFRCYARSYGRLKDITFPTRGNHEGRTGFVAYRRYWRGRVGDGRYYSADLGRGWRLINLDTDPVRPWGVRRFADQERWLARELARRPNGDCTIVMWHRPVIDAGWGDYHGNAQLEGLWRLARRRARILLVGHVHDYQRLAPPDAPGGFQMFVVGTGGGALDRNNWPTPGIVTYNDGRFGALRLELRRGSARFAWHTLRHGILDRGTVRCSSAAPPAAARPLPAPSGDLPPGVAVRVGATMVTKADVASWVRVIARSQQIDVPRGVSTAPRPLPAPGTRFGRDLRAQAVRYLLSATWVAEGAREEGIAATPAEVDREFVRITRRHPSDIKELADEELRRLRRAGRVPPGSVARTLELLGIARDQWLFRARTQVLENKLRRRAIVAAGAGDPRERMNAVRAYLRRFVPARERESRCAPGYVIPGCGPPR